MLPTKENQVAKHLNELCRICGEHTETQCHKIEECHGIMKKIRMEITKTTKYQDIFNDDDVELLRDMANYII